MILIIFTVRFFSLGKLVLITVFISSCFKLATGTVLTR